MPDLSHETRWRAEGFLRIAGIDEAGRGPLAGPVTAAAVILPEDYEHPLLNDSKQLVLFVQQLDGISRTQTLPCNSFNK